jgi:hypothetical protein
LRFSTSSRSHNFAFSTRQQKKTHTTPNNPTLFLHQRKMKTNKATLLLGTLLFSTTTVVSGRQIRGTNEQQQVEQQGISSIADSLLSWIRRDQEVEDVQEEPVTAQDGADKTAAASAPIAGKRSEVRQRPEIVAGGLSKVFDEFRNWEGPTKEEKKAAREAEKEAEVEAMEAKAQQKGEKKQAAGGGDGKNGMKWNKKNKKVATEPEGEVEKVVATEPAGEEGETVVAAEPVGEGETRRRRDLRSDNVEAYAKGAQRRGRHEGVGNINFWRKSGLNKFRNEDRRRLAMS